MDLRDEKGATAVEYGIMLGGIFLVIFASVSLFGQSVTKLITLCFNYLSAAIGA